MIIPVVLSGGSGTRLWPLSREQFPKQLLPLTGGSETMLQATVARTAGLPGVVASVVVCNEAHRFMVAEQLRQAGVTDHNVAEALEMTPRDQFTPRPATHARAASSSVSKASARRGTGARTAPR